MSAALHGLGDFDLSQWSPVLSGTREAWRAAYERQPSVRLDRALHELRDFATDGEPDGLHFEPAA